MSFLCPPEIPTSAHDTETLPNLQQELSMSSPNKCPGFASKRGSIGIRSKIIRKSWEKSQETHRKIVGKITQAVLCHMLRYFYGKYVQIIGLKAPGNYLDQFGSNKILVLLWGDQIIYFLVFLGLPVIWIFMFYPHFRLLGNVNIKKR